MKGEAQLLQDQSQEIPRQAFVILVIGVAAVSLAAIFIRLAQDEQMPSLLIACGRLLLAALLLTPAVIRLPTYQEQLISLTMRDRLLAFVSGFFLAMHFTAWVTSLEYTTVLISVVLVTTTPIWVALIEVPFLRARLSNLVLVGLVIALAGGLVIGLSGASASSETVTRANDQRIGAFLSVVGAITVAVYLVIGRSLRGKLSLTPYIWLVYGIAALIMCVLILISGTIVTGHSTTGYAWIFATALIPQLVGHSSLNYALAYLPATYVSLSTQLEPILSAIAAAIVFGEIPAIAQIMGGGIILFGVVTASIGQAQQKVESIVQEAQ